MCNPIAFAAVTLVMTAVTTKLQIDQANKQADQQAEAIRAKGAADRAALKDKDIEITESANVERFERKKQLQREIASQRVASSEAGLFGNTAMRQLSTALVAGGQDVSLINKQESNLHKQVGRQFDASKAGQDLQLAGLSWTSPLMAGLQIGSNALNAGVQGYQAGKSF